MSGSAWHQLVELGIDVSVLPKILGIVFIAKNPVDRKESLLRWLGWKTLTLWECEIDDEAKLERKLLRFLT